MKGLRGTELAMPFHPLYTPLGPSPGGTDRKMAHRSPQSAESSPIVAYTLELIVHTSFHNSFPCFISYENSLSVNGQWTARTHRGV